MGTSSQRAPLFNDVSWTLSISIAFHSYTLRDFGILMAGGFFHKSDMMFESAEGLRFLQGIRANKVFLSASGVHEELGLTCAHNYEVLGKQTIIKSALKKILLVDSGKFDSIKTVFFAQLRDIDVIVTDSGISSKWRNIINGKDIELKIV
jgi:DeoR family deoxyribose operon repressor